MQPIWMDQAWAHFGVRELRGHASNPVIREMYRDVGFASVTDDEVPWCAAFVGACLERADVKSTKSLRARSYIEWGETSSTLNYGSIAVLSRGQNPALGHVGFVVGAEPNRIFLLGGNQSNAVNVAAFPRSRLLSIRLPENNQRGRLNAPETFDFDPAAQDRTAISPRFHICLAHVLEMEGGFTDDPHDPGGPTNRGVTLQTFAAHRGEPLTAANRSRLVSALRQMPTQLLEDIYHRRYWRPSRAGDLPSGVDLMHFDASVNHGVGGGAKLLQRAVRVDVDGEIGPITLRAVREADPHALIDAYARERIARYRSLPHFWRFGRGWLSRTRQTVAVAEANVDARTSSIKPLQTGKPAPTGKSGDPTVTMTTPTTNLEMPSKWWGESMTLWGAFITTMSTVLPVVGPLFGLSLTPDAIEQVGTHVLAIGQAVGGIAGIMMTVFGRLRAQARLVGKTHTD